MIEFDVLHLSNNNYCYHIRSTMVPSAIEFSAGSSQADADSGSAPERRPNLRWFDRCPHLLQPPQSQQRHQQQQQHYNYLRSAHRRAAGGPFGNARS